MKGCNLKDDFLPWRANGPSCSLVSEVSRALDDEGFRDQWVARTKNGAIGAVPFLAVILWAFCGEKPDAETDSRIVNGWAANLLDATQLRVAVLGLQGPHREVTPFDPITFLELRRPLENWSWVLTVDNADDFLIERSIGFKCSDVLAYWRGEDSPYTARPTHHPEAIAELASPLAATAGAEGARADSLRTRQDRRLARLRELGGHVVKKSGEQRVIGITALVNSETVIGAHATSVKTIRADVKAAYKRETEAKRGGFFTDLGSR